MNFRVYIVTSILCIALVIVVWLNSSETRPIEGTYQGTGKHSYVFDNPVWKDSKYINRMQIKVIKSGVDSYWVESDFFRLGAHKVPGGLAIRPNQYGRLNSQLLKGTEGTGQGYDISYSGTLMQLSEDDIDISIKIETTNAKQGTGFGFWTFRGSKRNKHQ